MEPQCDRLAPCCYPDYAGQIIQGLQTPRECLRLGGVTVAEDESCGMGACCMGCGRCVENTLEGECTGLGGQFQGEDSFCGGCTGEGACCLPAGGCISPVSILECVNRGGVFYGETWSDEPIMCADVDCPPELTGACCLQDGSCEDALTTTECNDAGGTFMGVGALCEDPQVDCTAPEEDGVCCDLGGRCRDRWSNPGINLTAYCHAIPGATWLPGETDCSLLDPALCWGACCDYYGCTGLQSPTSCGYTSGTFQGVGTSCYDSDTVRNCWGACCHVTGICWTLTHEVCDATYLTTFMGMGTTCGFGGITCPETA